MMKLLKYDWKRNGAAIAAAFIIMLAAQIAMTVFGWLKEWDEAVIFAVTVALYGLAAFLAVLMACQTFNANLKAYSRRLLPLPSLYTVATPIILLLLSHILLFLLYVAHDGILSLMFEAETPLELASPYLDAAGVASILAGYVWGTVFTVLVIFFSIALSHTMDGKTGTFAGVVACLVLFTVISFIESFISPSTDASTENLGFINMVEGEAADGSISVHFEPFALSQAGTVLFELVAGAALVYGIVFIMNRKMKL